MSPTVRVQTSKVPRGVSIGILRTPAAGSPAAGGGTGTMGGGAAAQPARTSSETARTSGFMVDPPGRDGAGSLAPGRRGGAATPLPPPAKEEIFLPVSTLGASGALHLVEPQRLPGRLRTLPLTPPQTSGHIFFPPPGFRSTTAFSPWPP